MTAVTKNCWRLAYFTLLSSTCTDIHTSRNNTGGSEQLSHPRAERKLAPSLHRCPHFAPRLAKPLQRIRA